MLNEWTDLLLELEKSTAGYRPPVAARMHAYLGLGAYLSSVTESEFEDLSCFLQNMDNQSDVVTIGLDAGLSVNSCYSRLAELFFVTAPPAQLGKVKLLESKFRKKLGNRLDPEKKMRSISYGFEMAEKVWKYSMSDTHGHDAFLYNYDEKYIPPECPLCWEKTGGRPMPALLPNWKNVRTLVIDTGDLQVIPPPAFCPEEYSQYFSQAYELIMIQQNLNREEKWIAEFWSDDKAGLTMSPPGRWISIAKEAAALIDLDFRTRLQMNMVLGLAMSDAAVLIWNAKYTYHLMRPETFVKKFINQDWYSHIPSPAFPTYPSGHAAFGATADVILSAYLGDHFAMTDYTHHGRKEFEGDARSFNSFREMAIENAWSRVLAGVHFRMDCDAGLDLGYRSGYLFKSKIGLIDNNATFSMEGSNLKKTNSIF